MPKSLFPSFLRTVVPIVAGLLLGWAARAGLDLDDGQVTGAVTAALTMAYYAAFRLLEHAAERLHVPWLRTAAGLLLGWARPPQYEAPAGPDADVARLARGRP
jgi:hypothetical protein